ncbi:PDZ and LIM domain protein 7-like [Liolophura sinensis]|uniref:PDZ and LIM domain protein 7-like n=1 Tax=Liolophura sinensis TaxID=3198878 RepID=UPI00315842C9
MDEPILVQLRRNENSTPWGFRLQGGFEYGSCLYIQKVKPKSIADKAGLKVGDGLLRIGQTPAVSLNHDAAKVELLRAGNELDLLVKRGAVDVQQETTSENESKVEEEPTRYTAYTNPNVQSRSFRILQASLNYSDPNASQ